MAVLRQISKINRSTSAEVICKINLYHRALWLREKYFNHFEMVLNVVPRSSFMSVTKGLKEPELPEYVDDETLYDYAIAMSTSIESNLNENKYYRFRDYQLISLHPHHSIILENEVIRLIADLRKDYGKALKVKHCALPHEIYICKR